MMSLDLASHSKKIRVGQAPIVLPDWHPLRVAEDIALLDNMTEGRVDFGVAKGLMRESRFNLIKMLIVVIMKKVIDSLWSLLRLF